MEVKVISSLLVYGPLGIICVIALAVAWKLYRDLSAERIAHAAELAKEREAHKQAMEEWQQRYVQKAETWMAQYHELSRSMNAVLESFSKHYDERRR